ncbi:hypothetical protein C7450_104137 [Chelatococcus asaccharovorans]|uniref:CBS domain-containing protein n=1 Tax=Chelatococcus asaccharovorans TaxID=28210 RepID=A0A2V3U8E6_9HYPH|nr:hypothetical protein C7450_104137 [Chelatococcus asaccharovorans]
MSQLSPNGNIVGVVNRMNLIQRLSKVDADGRNPLAAKRAFSGPLVPRRQLSLRQAAASVFSAETDFASGTWFLRGRPKSSRAIVHFT